MNNKRFVQIVYIKVTSISNCLKKQIKLVVSSKIFNLGVCEKTKIDTKIQGSCNGGLRGKMWQTDCIIPYDILIDILSRLRAKDVVRFRCVSKSWKTLIYSSYFVGLHHNRSIQTSSNKHFFMSLTDYCCYQFIDSDKIQERVRCNTYIIPYTYRAMAFASGLYLVSIDVSLRRYAIYNPSTHECKKLPLLPDYTIRYFSKWCSAVGFYYDSASEDFKVLFMLFEVNSNVQTVIYSLRRNSWCLTDGGTCRISYILQYEGLFFRGALHWLHFPENEIVAFDIGTENYRIIPLPNYPYWDGFYHHRRVGELAECLYFMNWNNEGETYYLWMMLDYGVNNSWTKLLSLPLSYVLGIQPLCYSKKSDEILFMGETWERKMFFTYDVKKQTVNKIHQDAVTTRDDLLIENLVQLSNYGKRKEI